MRILVIGHPLRFEKIKNVIKDTFNDIEAEFIDSWAYSDTDNTLKIIESKKNSIDALLFTGELAFDWFNPESFPDIISDYLHKDSAALLKMLLQALYKEYDIYNISIDSFDKHLVDETYEEIEFNKDNKNIYIYPKFNQGSDYLETILNFHNKNFNIEKVSCCFTAASSIYRKLSEEKIPCFLFQPTKETIKSTLLKLQLKHSIQVKEYNQIVAIAFEIDLPNEESLINEDEYQIMLENISVSKQVYMFAQKIEAAVQDINYKEFILFSTKKILENETDNLETFNIFKMVNDNTSSTISMGLGYGKTAREAKNNAILGLLKAKKYGGNNSFIIYDKNRIIGPIDYLKKSKSEIVSKIIDEKFLNIAEKCGISINTIFKLDNILQQHKKDCFTANELAEYFGASPRTIYRIIDKLEQQGFAKIVGKKIVSDSGRPSRLVKLIFY